MIELPAWLPPLLVRLGQLTPAFALLLTGVVSLTPDSWLDDHTRDARTPARPYLLLGFAASAAWCAVRSAPLAWERVRADAARRAEERRLETAVRRLPPSPRQILDLFEKADGLPLRLQHDGDNVELLLAEGLIRHAGAHRPMPREFVLFRPAEGVLEIFRRVRTPLAS